jgi:biopolymer transport protein TolR
MRGSISKIEITPLIGVALILVIVFMVTSPLMMTPLDMNIDLPKAKTVEAKSESNITISISQENILALNEKQLTYEQLSVELTQMIAEHTERLVVIRADKSLRHRVVLDLLSMAKNAGARKLAIATLQRNRRGL